ncbi:AAA family ATPase [Oceanisphaera sp. IT1-181]|uniref:AAA family ATPase n=1 Tax=Oceanisphaera sp. IT1-181 TaxID=3081199 RepID=UPI0029CA02A4|nr:AAA family ATPase [Oceanisphaera sp. IT1-181]
MIERVYIDNFKSLVEFELRLAHFTCLIGLNGAGKSTVLQALDFASAIMLGEVEKWLAIRRWEPRDLNSRLVKRSNIELEVDLEVANQRYRWQATFNRSKLCCTAERIIRLDDQSQQVLFSLKDGRYQLNAEKTESIPFEYQGSLLSQLKPELLSDELKAVKDRICALRSLDLLSPQTLREKVRKTDRADIGMGGEQLSAFVHQLTDIQKAQLLEQLQHYYPQIIAVNTKALRSGWIQLEIIERFHTAQGGVHELETEARHINDGLLRLLAILAQQFSSLESLLFDEIENGINPEVTEQIVDALVASPKQIIVTTHSPMVLNYLDDAIAKEAVVLLYKRANGQTRSVRFFDLPTAAHKLESLAPGDAMLDVYLHDMALEAEQQEQ